MSQVLRGNLPKNDLIAASSEMDHFFFCALVNWRGALYKYLHYKRFWLIVLSDDKISRCKVRFGHFSEPLTCRLPERKGF